MKKIAITTAGVVGAAAAALLLYQIWPTAERPAAAAELASPAEKAKEPDPLAGFLPDAWQTTSVREEVLERINLPFLHRELVGQTVKVAQIKGNGVYFSRTYPSGTKLNYHNTLLTDGKIVTLASTGQLLMVELYSMKDLGLLPGQAALEDMEKSYRSGREKYDSLPAKPDSLPAKPAVTFQAVLDNSLGRGEEIEKCKRIEAIYVVYSQGSITAAAPMWIVHFFGFPPFPAIGIGGMAEEKMSEEKLKVFRAQRTHFRYFLNSEGKVLGGDNQP